MAAADDWPETARTLLAHLFFAEVPISYEAEFADDIGGLVVRLVILGFQSRNPCL